VVFTATGAVAVALIIGLGTSTWLFFKERDARRDAELGRANEITLRRQAEAHEKIAQAAMLVGQNRLEEAEQLASGISSPESAVGGAALFRSLGDWAAMQGHWPQAVEHFTLLLQVDQFETWDVSTLDYSRCGVAILAAGDLTQYEHFRQAAIKRFAHTTDPLIAERTVKNSLLLPADSAMMTALVPLADIAAKSISGTDAASGVEPWMVPWRCLSLALMEYRREHSAEAINWGRRCLNYGNDNPARVATAQAILAMSYFQLGQTEEAHSELTQSRDLIGKKTKDGFDPGNGTEGYWYDWLLGRILLREAEALIEGSPQPALPSAPAL
jgi:tetratricopeptide (TPR) repeat protein